MVNFSVDGRPKAVAAAAARHCRRIDEAEAGGMHFNNIFRTQT